MTGRKGVPIGKYILIVSSQHPDAVDMVDGGRQ